MGAAVLSGAFQKVTLGPTSKVLGGGKYSISGETRKTVEISEFGDDIDVFEFTSADGGTISLTDVLYDPANAEQNALRALLAAGSKLLPGTTSGIRFWLNTTSYMTIGTSGTILLTSVGKVEADRNGMAKTGFEGKVSGAFMYVV